MIAKILEIFQAYRQPSGLVDQYETEGKPKLIEKLQAFVAASKPIRFSMLGYLFKSMNTRDKVLGKLPDKGEVESLMNFQDFSREISSVYAPGTDINIISDGYAFGDVYGTPDSEIAQYEESVRDISKGMPITWYNLNSFYPAALSHAAKIEKLMSQFGISQEVLEKRILMDPDVNALYRGMIKFMNGDLAIKDYPSSSQLQKHAKIMAREMMHRNEAYSALVRTEFADCIRLSMHPSVNNGTKYSFQLIRSPFVKHSPWHSCLLVHKDGSFESIHRADGIGKYELVNVEGRPYYFIEK